MIVGAVKLNDTADLSKYSEADILKEFDPRKLLDSIDMGTLRRDGYYSDNFIMYIVSCKDPKSENEINEINDLYTCYRVMQRTEPKLFRVFWLKKDTKMMVVYPFYLDEENTVNFLSIKQELLRFIQFLYINGVNPNVLDSFAKKYCGLLIKFV